MMRNFVRLAETRKLEVYDHATIRQSAEISAFAEASHRKAKVEAAAMVVERWILARLRNQRRSASYSLNVSGSVITIE